MIEFYEELEPVDPDNLVQGELRSEVMFKEDKKYHVDLKVRTKLVCNRIELSYHIYPWANAIIFLIADLGERARSLSEGFRNIHSRLFSIPNLHSGRWNAGVQSSS